MVLSSERGFVALFERGGSSARLAGAIMTRQKTAPEGIYTDFAYAIRRMVGSLSTRQASIKTGGAVSASTVSRAANGDKIDAEKLDILAVAFGRDPNDFRPLIGLPRVSSLPGEPAETVSSEVAQILEYIKDDETRAVVKFFHGLAQEERAKYLGAWSGLRKYRNAGELARELEEEATLGKRAGREKRSD